MAIVTKNDIIETLENMKLVEINELVKMVEEKFGVSAAPVAGVAVAAGAGAGAAAPAAEEQTEFTVVLAAYDEAKKIQVIKAVRTLTTLNLKEAKELVEGAPKELLKDVSKDDAAKAKKELEEAGAKVELK